MREFPWHETCAVLVNFRPGSVPARRLPESDRYSRNCYRCDAETVGSLRQLQAAKEKTKNAGVKLHEVCEDCYTALGNRSQANQFICTAATPFSPGDTMPGSMVAHPDAKPVQTTGFLRFTFGDSLNLCPHCHLLFCDPEAAMRRLTELAPLLHTEQTLSTIPADVAAHS